jgi:hypothetical protein
MFEKAALRLPRLKTTPPLSPTTALELTVTDEAGETSRVSLPLRLLVAGLTAETETLAAARALPVFPLPTLIAAEPEV